MADARKAKPLAALRTPGVRKQPTGPLTKADRRLWRQMLWLRMYREGWTVQRIAVIEGVHHSTVYRALVRLKAIDEGIRDLT